MICHYQFETISKLVSHDFKNSSSNFEQFPKTFQFLCGEVHRGGPGDGPDVSDHAPRENGNYAGRSTRTGCTGMSVQMHGLHH